MDPAKVMRCFGSGCEKRRQCGRYAAYLIETGAAPMERMGFNICEFTRADRFIPLSTSRIHGTHGALPNAAAASAKQGGTPSRRDSQI